MEKAFHIQRLTTKVSAAEKSIDEAMAVVADLMVEMQAAQKEFEVSRVLTDPSFAKIAEAMSLLAQSRTSVVTGHKRMAKLHDRVVAIGTSPVCLGLDIEDAEVSAEVLPLRVVG
jgi:hypothetical protein